MSKNTQNVVTRFAPSPTGLLHAGNYRTAVFSYLFSRQNKGKFILRIEDTDKERSKKEYAENILESLKWLGLEYDEIYRQSERVSIYRKYIENLIDKKFAYISHEEKDGKKSDVIRFKNPGEKVTFKDMIRGDITMDTSDLGDFVIAKNLDEPVFHLAVVIDDSEMGITHIIRGEDHISNTPRQILIARAIGAREPIYAHLPLVLASDRSKLSKRKGALAMTEYRERGYLPEALLNYMAFLGWNPGGDKEIMSIQELLKEFKIEKIQKGGAIFNEEKLLWLNKEYIKILPLEKQIEEVKRQISNFQFPIFKEISDERKEEIVKKVTPIVIDRISKWGDVKEMMERGELDYFFTDPEYKKESLLWKTEKDFSKTKNRLEFAVKVLEKIPDEIFTAEKVKEILWPYAEKEGKGNVLWPMRFALSGKAKSPDPFVLAGILGKKTTLFRLQKALEMLS